MKATLLRSPIAPLIAVIILLGFLPPPAGGSTPHRLCAQLPLMPGEKSPFANPHGTVIRADTTWFGDYQIIGGEYHARTGTSKQSVMWTFDRGNGPTDDPSRIYDGEGWAAKDLTRNVAAYFRIADVSLNLGPGVPPPIIDGARSVWIGADYDQTRAYCWSCNAGYGDDWRQRLVSEPLPYNGSGDVTLSFKYFNDSESCYDGTQVYLKRGDGTELLLNPSTCFDGGFTDSIGRYDAPALYSRSITQGEIGGAQSIRIILEFASDYIGSSADGSVCTVFGPFGADDIRIIGGGIDAFYDFESGLDPWTALLAPIGDFAGVADVGCYTILDPCICKLSGNILEAHDGLCGAGTHPTGQHVMLESPICDVEGNIAPKDIFMDLDMYVEMPLENGVLFRSGWMYYPWTCAETGAIGWSPRVGENGLHFYGTDPLCQSWRFGGTHLDVQGTPVPADAEKVIAILEIFSDCEAFTITNCTGETNPTPLFDNIAVGTTAWIDAPSIAFDVGAHFQDVGSYPSSLFDPRAPGPANTEFDKYPGDLSKPDLAGDTLVVVGPTPGSDPNKRWEARLWWRIARRAPLQSDRASGAETKYKIWRDRVADGKQIDRPYKPEFTYGWMDSAQNGSIALKNKFLSSFRENDDDYVGEGSPENEMLWDDVFFPGTRVEYFITSDYVSHPGTQYYYPDTTGSFFFDFEILPGLRTASVPNCGGGGVGVCVFQPATLYIDAYGRGARFFIENGLRTILNGLPACTDPDGCPIPVDANWDRYDFGDACACWGVPFARGSIAGSNNGMTLNQLIGYRAIIMNTGTFGSGTMQDADFALFDDWLTSSLCNANVNRQVFVMDGDQTGNVLLNYPSGASFMSDALGASLFYGAFNCDGGDPPCSPVETAYCVRDLAVPGGAFPTEFDIDAYGNWCPNHYLFNVLGTSGTGFGNRYYVADGGNGSEANYAQVLNENLASEANYRTVLNGISLHHLTLRDASGPDPCPRDNPSIFAAIVSELGAALRWGFGVGDNASIPRLTDARQLAVCQGTGNFPTDVGASDGRPYVNRLYANAPNPFNPRTTIKYSLAAAGPVRIEIYDVDGRHVRTIVDARMPAGPHDAIWDGTNERGARVGSGIYWAQMRAGSYTSNRKMVVLK